MSDGERGGEGPTRHEEVEGLAYRYDRERRLERAPESVRWLAERREGKRPGFLKSLFATRANRLLLFMIVALAIAFNVVPLLSGPRSSGKLAGDRYSAKAFWFEGKVLVGLAREAGGAAPAEAFPLVLSAAAGKDIAKASFAAGRAGKEDFRLAIECPGGKPAKVIVLVERGGAALKLETPVE